MSRNPLIRVVYFIMTVFMAVVFVSGVHSFFTVPGEARAEAEEIERMLREQQEEEERLRREREEELRRQEEEERLHPYRKLFSDANEMQVIGIGDSVMLAALPQMYGTFPNGYFDAVFGRTIYDGKKTLYALEEAGTLGDVIVFCLGANSYIEEADVEELIQHSGGRPTFWVTTFGVSNDSTDKMRNVAARYDNAYMVEWGAVAREHINEYILADGLHPNDAGSWAYAELIRETINEALLY